MKQRIDVSQLNELTDEQKQKLREWWKPQEGDYIAGEWLNENDGMELQFLGIVLNIITDGGILLDTGGSIRWCPDLPLLSIGQMIELLGTKIMEIMPNADLPSHETELKTYSVTLCQIKSDDFYFKEPELCDALWQAVKEAL